MAKKFYPKTIREENTSYIAVDKALTELGMKAKDIQAFREAARERNRNPVWMIQNMVNTYVRFLADEKAQDAAVKRINERAAYAKQNEGRPYYTLVTRYGDQSPWRPEFGSYRKVECLQEAREYFSDEETKVIKTDPTQSKINEAVERLNRKTKATA